jgi:LacI family repressor for deo operon, udp, cdd, tsx, nupC, and nupG
VVGIDDVARRAGVSTTTVSRALSGRGRIAQSTRDAVRAAAEELGYVVSASASSLATGRTQSIGVIVPLMDRWFFATVIDGIARRLAPHGYDVALYNLTEEPDQRRHLFDVALRRRRVDALIALSVDLDDGEIDRLLGLGLPVVGLGTPSPRLSTLRIDDTAVARTATAHLVSLGHTRIAHLGWSRPDDPGLDVPSLRRRGFEAELRACGIRPFAFVPTDFTVEDGYRAASELLDTADRPTAVFAASDEIAFGALFAARERGLDVPGDLSIIGVDGHPLGAFLGLTTIAQSAHAQGERAADAVRALLENTTRPPTAALPFELVVRSSTAPPR